MNQAWIQTVFTSSRNILHRTLHCTRTVILYFIIKIHNWRTNTVHHDLELLRCIDYHNRAVSAVVFIIARWIVSQQLNSMAALVHKASLAGNLQLTVSNSLLLHYVRTNSMAAADRTHNNEQKHAILMVNGCFICTWLPDCIIGTYTFLVYAGFLQCITSSHW